MKRNAQPKSSGLATWLASPTGRAVVSVLLALHVAAVFIAPAAVSPSSSLFTELRELFRPYLDVAYLNHGYGFFSPNPSSSFIIRYSLERSDGKLIEGSLPDLNQHWPRLLYHRHFMLTSQVEMFSNLPEAYLKHLQKTHDAKYVRLEYVEHRLPTSEEVLAGRKLDDPSSYQLVGIATIDQQGRIDVQRIDPPPAAEQQYAAPRTPVYGEEVPALIEPVGRVGRGR